VDRQIAEVSTNIGQKCPNESPAETVAKVNAIAPPDPLPEFNPDLADSAQAALEAQLAKPAVHAGPAPEPPVKPTEAPKAKSTQEAVEHKPRAANDNGKPIYAMPVWRELTETIGRAINRNDAVNHLLRSPEDHKYIHDCLSNAFDRAEGWHEKAKAVTK
jgi:hypothetical protein